MKNNRSLELSVLINKQLQEGLLGPMSSYFPEEMVQTYSEKGVKRRDRLYSLSNTIQTMIASAAYEDKTLQHSVLVFSDVLKQRTQSVLAKETEVLAEQSLFHAKRIGRPRTRGPRIAKSKLSDISLSTSSYATARQRVPVKLMDDIFISSRQINNDATNSVHKRQWHGKEIFITDGTYLQLQDSPELHKKYAYNSRKDTECTQAILEGLIHQGSGCVHAYRLANRGCSELDLVGDLIKEMPENSLILADDLYNSYAVFCLAKHQKIDIVVPAKRRRTYTLIKTIAQGDEIVEIPITSKSIKRLDKQPLRISAPKTLIMRRISYTNPAYPEKQSVLFTSLLDESIDKTDIVTLYASRWDIEISIRELKTIMHINILRSKTDDMIHKELAASIIAYNFIRKIILSSVKSTEFSPQEGLFYEIYSSGKEVLIDKRGRVFKRWSPGCLGYSAKTHPEIANPPQA